MQSYAAVLRRTWLSCLLLATAIAVSFHPVAAHAASAGGSLPWDTPLTTLRNDITGPVAFTIPLLAMVACGAACEFRRKPDSDSDARRTLIPTEAGQ